MNRDLILNRDLHPLNRELHLRWKSDFLIGLQTLKKLKILIEQRPLLKKLKILIEQRPWPKKLKILILIA